jgi:hypothetical protein
MTADEIKIPQITPDSVLIPKIETAGVKPQTSIPPQQQNQPLQNRPQQIRLQPKINQENRKPSSLPLKIAVGFMAFILILLVAIGIPALLTYQKGMALYKSVKGLEVAAKSQDLSQIKTQITATSKSLASFKTSYTLLSWTRIIPYFGGYVSDVGHAVNAAQAGMDAGTVVLAAIEPYSDLLGLKGAGGQQTTVALDGAKTAQDRIDFIVKSLPSLLPQIDKISGKMKIVEDEVSKINAERYPTQFKGVQLRNTIKSGQDLISQASNLLVNGKPVIENATYLLGMDSPRTYFVLFQNDKELRPTGGFMTGYAIMTVDKAKFSPTVSDDIYNLDARYKPSIPAPDPIVKYLKGPYVLSKNLRLRDMNWSPDFVQSMQMFSGALAEVGIKKVDGIIAVDTKVLENLLDVIGPIGVPGFGNFSTAIDPECNCSQVIHELEAYADIEGPIIWDPLTGKIIQRPPNSENRKKIIGPLMNSILANAMGQPKDKLAPLFSAAFNSVMEKDVLFYLNDSKVQKAVADFGIGGVIKDYSGDYLHINDANLGGRKSNLYSTEDVQQDVKVAKDGSVTKTLTITYKNPEKQDGWLNSVLPTWVRVYVPKGSTLIAVDGLEAKQDPYEDLGKTVFAGYFQLRPEGVAKVTFQYKLPFKVKGQYKLLIQKQPGTKDYLYTINVGKAQQEFYLKTDKEVTIGL